jgi:ubiquinone/menaquinone biosynthesis C-methylase UbiE
MDASAHGARREGAPAARDRAAAGVSLADDYDAAAAAWADGPARVYRRLAGAMLDRSPVTLLGARVLDVGAGTAVAGEVAMTRGAREVHAADLAVEMLRLRPPGITALVADAARLPLRNGSVDLVAAGFCLSHLPDPGAALAEWRRVGRALVASAFAPGPPHPAKTAVDDALAPLGFVAPAWYRQVTDTSALVEDPGTLEALARDAGFEVVGVARGDVDAGLPTPDDVVRWRFGMAHLAPWLASLPDRERAAAADAARRAVADLGPVTIAVLVLSAR